MTKTPQAFRIFVAAGVLSLSTGVHGEDGHRLWLRYEPLPTALAAAERQHIGGIRAYGSDPSVAVAARELKLAIAGLLRGRSPDSTHQVILGTIADLERAGAGRIDAADVGAEGYFIRSQGTSILVSGNTGTGVLHGTFALIREMQLGHQLKQLNIRSRPRYALRLLNHWDNLDRSVERGYAGPSIWDWASLPGKIDQRYIDYARANASVGINGAVLNNVNADPKILTRNYLEKVAAIAAVLRPYGIRVYLSVRFSSPIEVGGLNTADPLDPQVQRWWRSKADEIYALVPDFGGFLVKANSEGQPGPRDYHRTQADGANVIADAVAQHGGTVFWRAFVYGNSEEDRAKQAYEEFKPLDGKFRDNVIVQVKNGPIDFQPREPFHPLFGQMPHTHVALEAQITREYLGQNVGIAYLAPMWAEVLTADTCTPQCGTAVSNAISAMAGVSNVGGTTNWTGTNFDQANWYAFGRLAWDPSVSPRQIAEEWTRQTWTTDPTAVLRIVDLMMRSRQAAVDFMTPLGLAHQMATGHHFGPGPWVCDLPQPSWNPCYYARADAQGIGFDRTRSGSDAVDEYAPEVARRFADLRLVPDDYLLWFHHLPWRYRTRSGRTLWDELVTRYDRGVATVAELRASWAKLRRYVDRQRWSAVAMDLRREEAEAQWWRDASIAYFQSKSNLPMPPGHSPPVHSLSWYQQLHIERPTAGPLRIAPGPACVVGTEGGAPCAR